MASTSADRLSPNPDRYKCFIGDNSCPDCVRPLKPENCLKHIYETNSWCLMSELRLLVNFRGSRIQIVDDLWFLFYAIDRTYCSLGEERRRRGGKAIGYKIKTIRFISRSMQLYVVQLT